MAQTTRPGAFRMQETQDYRSRGFYGKRPAKYLAQDFEIREFFKRHLDKEHTEKVEIERSRDSVNILIFTSRPGLIIGRKGARITELKNGLLKAVEGLGDVKIDVRAVKNVWTSAQLVAEWMASQTEQRVAFRRVMKQTIGKVMRNKEVKGVRAQMAGRLNGTEMARTEWLKEGELKRQTFRSDLDYADTQAHCSYGVIGIKVWIYKGEKI